MWVLNILGFSSAHINYPNQSLEGMKEPLNDSENRRDKNKTNIRAIRKENAEKSTGITKQISFLSGK